MESDLVPYHADRTLPAKAVLVLAPHPDDEVFGCGGAIASHVDAGVPVKVIILTDGAGFGDAGVREKESIAAAGVLGYGNPEFWMLPDRGLRCSGELVDRVVALVAGNGIDVIYAPSPWEIHPDHQQACLIAIEAGRRCGHPLRVAFYEIGAPLRPNVLLDITQFVARKDLAMSCFASQMVHQDYLRHIRALNQYRTYTLTADVQAAEAYLVLPADQLDNIHPTSDGLPIHAAPDRGVINLPKPLPLVSILIRSTDRSYLAEALASIAIQTYARIEVVVTAASVEHAALPERCGPYPLRLIKTDVALPRSKAANKAMANAHGQFFLFLDDDDWLMPGHIQRLADVFAGQPHALAVYTGISLVNREGQPLGQAFDLPFDAIRQLAGNLAPIHAVLFSADVIAQGCAFDESLDRYEDWDFWLQLTRLAPMVHLPGVSGVYRIHESSGVHVDTGPHGAAAKRIYAKEELGWSAQQVSDMMQRVWAYPEMEMRLSEAMQTLQFTREQLSATLRDAGIALADHVEITRRLDDMQARFAEANQQVGATHHLLAAEQQRAALLDQTLASTRQLMAERALRLQADLLEKSVQLESRLQKLDETAAKLAQQKADYAALLNTHSWRVTRPLRWISDLLRKVLKAG